MEGKALQTMETSMGPTGAPFSEIPKRNAGKPEGFTGETVSGALDRSFDGKGGRI